MNYTVAAPIAKQMRIQQVEAWFEVLTQTARAHGMLVKLEDRYTKSAIVTDMRGKRIGRLWIDGFTKMYAYSTGNGCYGLAAINTTTMSDALDGIAQKLDF